MMASIRKLIYKVGARPKLGSIFHSPTLDLTYAFDDAVKGIAVDRVSGGVRSSVEVEEAKILNATKYCPSCGRSLRAVLFSCKECPDGCCTAFVIENAEGLPVVTFEY